MAELGARKWVVLICTFAGTTSGPAASRDLIERLFLGEGEGGLFDYWKDLSGGRFDLSATTVHGPLSLSFTESASDSAATAQGARAGTHPRTFRVQNVVDDVADQVDFTGAQGVVVIVNEAHDVGATDVDLPGGERVPATIFQPSSFAQSELGHLFAHETAHMLGLSHSRRVGAQAEWQAAGRTDPNWAYTDGWCISGGIRDDGSGQDCRFNLSNPALNNARSGPAIKAGYARHLGWIPSDRVYTYRAHSMRTRRVAALYREQSSGDRLIQTTATYSDSHRYQVELRWKEAWDLGIPRHAFLVHRMIPGSHESELVTRSATQHDWAPGERFVSVEDGLGIEFESIDTASRSGVVRLTRVVGQSADALVGGGWGMVALQRGTGAPFRYRGRPGQWTRVGDPAAQFAISGNALYGLSADRSRVWRYTGRDNLWTQVGDSADAILAGGWGLIALQRGTGIPFWYRGRRRWRRVGGPAAQFAITDEGLYGLSNDRQKIWRYTGEGQSWTQVGTSADALVAGGHGLLALQRHTGVPYLYLGSAHQWRKVGAPAAQFCFSTDALYGLSSDRRAIWRYTGEGEVWSRVGGAAHSIVAGGRTLYSLAPDRESITQY